MLSNCGFSGSPQSYGLLTVESYKEMAVNYEILFAGAQNQLLGVKITFNRGILDIEYFFFFQNC